MLTLGAILLLSCPSTCPAQDDSLPLHDDFPTLTQRFNQQSEPLDYVIAIDRSRSMKSYWNRVSKGLIEFVKVLQDGDHVSIVLFGDSATGKLPANACIRNFAIPGKLISSAQVKSDIAQEIRSLCEPDGDNTDIGEALEKTLGELNRPGGHTLKIVFFFTDFKHEPKSTSRYANKYSGTEDIWQQLYERRRNELSGKVVLSYAMLLNTGNDTGRDLKLGRVVFPDLEQVAVNQSSLEDYFTRIKSEWLRDRLKVAVKESTAIAQPFVKNIYQQKNELIALLEVPPNPLINTESLTNVQISDIKGGALTDYLIPIGPNQKEYPVDKTSREVEIPIATLNTNALITWQESTEFSFTLRAKQNLSPTSEITKLNLPASIEREIVATSIRASATGGHLGYRAVTGILLSILVGVMILQRRLRRDFIVGVFTIRDSKKEALKRERLSRNDKRTEYAIGDGGAPIKHGYRVPGADWQLLFYAVTPGLFGQRGIYLEVKKGIAELIVNGRKERLQPNDPPKLISRMAFVTVSQHSVEFDMH
jgi:hypothetical protein